MLLSLLNWYYSIPAQAINVIGTIEIWSNKTLPVTQGYYTYPIMVDMFGLKDLSDDTILTDFKLTTSCGEAVFSEIFNGSMASRYGESYVHSQGCDKLTITSAQGKINGESVNLIHNIAISEAKAIPMDIIYPEDRNAQNELPCEFKVLSSGTLMGQFLGIECDDYCYTAIKLDNGEIMGRFIGLDPEEFNVRIGTKVLINFNIEQFHPEDTGELCKKVYVIQSIEAVR
jgi:hypothetical protein